MKRTLSDVSGATITYVFDEDGTASRTCDSRLATLVTSYTKHNAAERDCESMIKAGWKE